MTDLNFQKPILIDLPMPIETDRLLLREPRFGDGKAIHEAKAESADNLKKWMIWAKYPGTEQDDEAMVRENHIKFLQKTDLMILAFDKMTGDFLGSTGLHRINWEKRIFEIGFWYRSSALNKGYATESTKALTLFAFEALNAFKVKILHAKDNIASKRVIEKCGFQFEYIAKDEDLLPDDSITDEHWYSLYNADHLKDLNVRWKGQSHE